MFDDLWCCDQVCDGLLQQEAPLHTPGLLPQKNNTVQVHGFLQIIVPLHLSTQPLDVISQEKLTVAQYSTRFSFYYHSGVVTQPSTLQTLFLRRKHDSTVNRYKVNFIQPFKCISPPSKLIFLERQYSTGTTFSLYMYSFHCTSQLNLQTQFLRKGIRMYSTRDSFNYHSSVALHPPDFISQKKTLP